WPMTSLATMRLEIAGALGRLTLERPEVLNAGDARFARDLKAAVATLAERPEIRVVALTGAGRAFSTGVDLTALAHGELGMADFIAWEDAMTAMERMDKLFIAGINGHCLGGGLQLAIVCRYRLAADDAAVRERSRQQGALDACLRRRLRGVQERDGDPPRRLPRVRRAPAGDGGDPGEQAPRALSRRDDKGAM